MIGALFYILKLAISLIAAVFMSIMFFEFFPHWSSVFFLLFVLIVVPIKKIQTFWEKLHIKGGLKLIILIILFILAVDNSPNIDTEKADLPDPTVPSTAVETIPATTIEETIEITEEPIQEITEPETTAPIETEATTIPETEPTQVTYIETQPPVPVETEPAQPKEEMVWIPTGGGSKYHNRSGCSNMSNPQEVTISTAKSRGFTACKRCY